MKRFGVCSAVNTFVLTCALFSSALAHSQSSNNYPVSATCTGGVGFQLCDNVANVNVTTDGLLEAQFISSSPGTCSDFRIHWLVDSVEVAISGFVAPAGTSAVASLGPVSPGPHVVGLQAEGTVGGCNSGTLAAWAGTAAITTTGTTGEQISSVPTLSQWGLVVMAGLLCVAGLVAMSRTKTS